MIGDKIFILQFVDLYLRRVRLSVYTKLVTKPVYNVCGKIHGDVEPGIVNFSQGISILQSIKLQMSFAKFFAWKMKLFLLKLSSYHFEVLI